MKVIKRNGKVVEFDQEKIKTAIAKANKEVKPKERATNREIKKIINYIIELDKKRILVEDIQDIIEQKLMEYHRYKLSKCYIVYRYTRALVRKQNTTDESILGLIRNENKKALEGSNGDGVKPISAQRNDIAGEVSKDLSKRILLPEKISKANEEGILYFHNSDYFIQPIFNCSLINIKDMLENGTVINRKKINPPQSFIQACMIMMQIITNVAYNQYGGQSVDLSFLGKYLKNSYDTYKSEFEKEVENKLSKKEIQKLVENRVQNELKNGIKEIQYQINTLMEIGGKKPFITFFIYVKKDDPFLDENVKIFEEILKQRIEGLEDEEGKSVVVKDPKLVYVLDECNNLSGEKYDYLTKLAIKCSAKEPSAISYISAKKMRENYKENVFCPMGDMNFLSLWKNKDGNYQFEGRFNQGIVSINLPQIAIMAEKNEKEFWKLLDERLELCKEALMCRHYALRGTTSDVSPIIWQYGAIARLNKNEKIDEMLKGGYSTLSLGYVGLYETTKLMKDVSQFEPNGYNFALKVLKKLKDATLKWKKENDIEFNVYGVPGNYLGNRFMMIDRKKYGKIKDITDKEYYTNSYHIDKNLNIDELDRIKMESEFQKLTEGGGISYINVSDFNEDSEEIKSIINIIYNNLQYVKLCKKSSK